MTWQTCRVCNLPVSPPLLYFVFFATICSYNFHWYLTPQSRTSPDRARWSQEHKNTQLLFYFAGVIGSVFFFFKLTDHWFAVLFAVLITFLYSAPKIPLPYFRFLKQVAIGKTIFLTTVWTYVTAIMPVFMADIHFNHELKFFAASRFFLIYAICILFDYRDRADDKEDGIRSMVTWFDEKGVNRIFWFSLFAFVIFTIGLLFTPVKPVYVLLLLLPGLVVGALYNYSKEQLSDYLYYFVLDGLMMISGLLMLVLPI